MIYNQVFEYLTLKNPDLAVELRRKLWGFEEIIRTYDRKSLQLILFQYIQDYDTEALAACLHGVEKDIKTKILSCLSRRSRRDVVYELELAPLLPSKYVEAKQNRLCDTAIKLNERGQIISILEDFVY